MRRYPIVLVLGSFLVVGCATSEPTVDASGLVLFPGPPPGQLYVHPARSIDDYDEILVSEVDLAYAPKQPALSEADMQRFRTMAYGVVTRQIPAAGQLSALKPGPCAVRLGVQLSDLEFPKPGSRENGATTVVLEFEDSVSGDPIVRYAQHRELSTGLPAQGEDVALRRLESTLEIVAEGVRSRFRDVLPVKQTDSLAGQGCKGTIGAVRKAAKEATAKSR